MLQVKNISFAYTSKEVIKNVSFIAKKGEYVAIIGESGCGKSTLLEIIYGLQHIEKGAVFYNNQKLLGPNFHIIPGEECMKYLPQDFDLMPYTTVEENVGKHISSLDPNKPNRIKELLKIVDMTDYLKTKVKNLSGGQKQRVAIAKVLAKEPEVLLLDEPFSHIDNYRKNDLRRSLFTYLKQKNVLCIVATHDFTDALSFANKIVVMKHGEVIAENTPEVLYNNPKSAYVASFFNEINEVNEMDIFVENATEKKLLFYPDQIKIVTNKTHKATVVATYFKGNHYLIEVDFNGKNLFLEHKKFVPIGKTIGIQFKIKNN